MRAAWTPTRPRKPFGGAEEFTFTPGRQPVVFTARDAGREEAWSTNLDLFRVAVDGSQRRREPDRGNRAWDTEPVFSPDGKTLAYLAMTRPGFEADRFAHRAARPGRRARSACSPRAGTARPASSSGRADGKTLYATADDVGQHPLFAIDVATGKVTPLVAQGHDRRAAAAAPATASSSLATPAVAGGAVHGRARTAASLRQLTHVNEEALAAHRAWASPSSSRFKGANGDTVYGYVVKPVGFEPGKKYPVAFLIHGGPQGSFGNHFHYRWNPQAYAGARLRAR